MTFLSEYGDQYPNLRLVRCDGVLEATLHTRGGPFVFDLWAHQDLGDAFRDISADPENRVMILTGTGDRFCTHLDAGGIAAAFNDDPHTFWMDIRSTGRRLVSSLLDIEIPVIAAVNGPVLTHSELPLLADVVLASNTTVFQDAHHFVSGLPPGDGMHTVWTTLLGPNRGRYFLMTGQRISATEALNLGLVGEVVAPEGLMERARELAHHWSRFPLPALKATRAALTLEWKQKLLDQLEAGLAQESLAALASHPWPVPDPPVVDLLADEENRGVPAELP